MSAGIVPTGEDHFMVRKWLLDGPVLEPYSHHAHDFFFHGVSAYRYNSDGSVKAKSLSTLVLIHTYVARLVGDDEFDISFIKGNHGLLVGVVSGMKIGMMQWFDMIGPLALMAWRAEQKSQP